MCHKIICLDYIREMASGDEKFIVDMIDLFLKQMNEVSTELCNAIERKNFNDFFGIIHKLKSSANLFQINNVVNLIVNFEQQKNIEIPIEKFKVFNSSLEELISKAVIELISEKELILKKII